MNQNVSSLIFGRKFINNGKDCELKIWKKKFISSTTNTTEE